MQAASQKKYDIAMAPEETSISDIIKASFTKIAPSWPLKNLIAVNPLQGFEDLPIEKAITAGAAYFQQDDLPHEMQSVNREAIKWLQAYFDEGQATISMPFRQYGLYAAWRRLAVYDEKLHSKDKVKQEWLQQLPASSEQTAEKCLRYLNINPNEQETFLTLMLTTLPGWAAYVKYRTAWAGLDACHKHPVTQSDYLAMRLVITCLLWSEAKALLKLHSNNLQQNDPFIMRRISNAEAQYRLPLLEKLAAQPVHKPHVPQAQLIFCIDVRSEPFRKALEATGDYQTYGFAGFFGLPVQVTEATSGESYASCPVLLSPKHEVVESPCGHEACSHDHKAYERVVGYKKLYQSVKYTFTAPFALVEGLGMASGVWMALRSLFPGLAAKLKASVVRRIRNSQPVEPTLDNITLSEQCNYAEGALKMMGLTSHFAPYVVFCGHGSTTQNNAYASALDCGACGGRHGASNARILAAIMNKKDVRAYLVKKCISIPETTRFVAAEHNTTTDEVIIFGAVSEKLKADLEKARSTNCKIRLKQLTGGDGDKYDSWLRSRDWAQVRPEWGLARNAAFIVAPRDITAPLNLEGRCFLHSYDYSKDPDGSSLAVILTAPMVVAEWINMQYLFSALDNVAYGGGSKITKNITGKIGVMQGNASDLMTGLPLQSVNNIDDCIYHEPQRLMCVVYAPRTMIDPIIKDQPALQKLFGNGWVQLACIEPETRTMHFLDRDFKWQKAN